MTEQEWQNATDPQEMLEFLRGKAGDRKLRLFACACCRAIWPLVVDAASRALIEFIERFADEGAEFKELFEARRAIGPPYTGGRQLAWSASELDSWDAASHTLLALLLADEAARSARWAGQVRPDFLLRDIFGTLAFHLLLPLSPSILAWNDGCVVKLAASIYEERDFSQERMAVLADALEEAGVADESILQHCRQKGATHVRGCWVVDAILQKD